MLPVVNEKALPALPTKLTHLAPFSTFFTHDHGLPVANLKTDLDSMSDADPLLADLIHNKLSIKTDFEN